MGIALACRRPEDVLLVRDDHDRFLFDVSTIPHATINFTDHKVARNEVASLLGSRLEEQSFQFDARVERAIATLSNEEIYILHPLSEKPDYIVTVSEKSVLRKTSGLQRLLDQQLMRYVGSAQNGDPQYGLTPVGGVVANRVFVKFS